MPCNQSPNRAYEGKLGTRTPQKHRQSRGPKNTILNGEGKAVLRVESVIESPTQQKLTRKGPVIIYMGGGGGVGGIFFCFSMKEKT